MRGLYRSAILLLPCLVASTALSAGAFRVVTLEGEVIEAGAVTIDGEGNVTVDDEKLPLDGLRSISPAEFPVAGETVADGRVVLICGSEFAARDIMLEEEVISFEVPGIGDWEVPIDAVRALRFGELSRGSRFQKGLLEWEATRDYDTIFISGGAELQEVDGLIEGLDEESLSFDRDGKLQSIPRPRAYGVVLASPILDEDERPACAVSLTGGTRLRADIAEMDGGQLKLEMVEGIEFEVAWEKVERIGIRSARLAYLSDLDVKNAGARPILAPLRSWQRDRSVAGLPLKIDDRVYDKGVGMAAGSFVTFPNDGPYDLLLAEIGIDSDTGGRGDCEFVVLAGGEEIFRQRVKGRRAATSYQGGHRRGRRCDAARRCGRGSRSRRPRGLG